MQCCQHITFLSLKSWQHCVKDAFFKPIWMYEWIDSLRNVFQWNPFYKRAIKALNPLFLKVIEYSLYAPLGLCPRLFMTTFSSGKVRTPSSSLSKSMKTSLYSATCVSVNCHSSWNIGWKLFLIQCCQFCLFWCKVWYQIQIWSYLLLALLLHNVIKEGPLNNFGTMCRDKYHMWRMDFLNFEVQCTYSCTFRVYS